MLETNTSEVCPVLDLETPSMLWHLSHRADKRSRLIADRHYNRQKIGSAHFVPPGRCLVLYAGEVGREAMWTTSWPFAQYVRHAWGGAWICSSFRNEGAGRASDLIRQAVAVTCAVYGQPPPLGMVTFVNRTKVKPTRVRGRNVWGWTYRKAGFVDCGETKGGLLALQMLPDAMPPPRFPLTDLEHTTKDRPPNMRPTPITKELRATILEKVVAGEGVWLENKNSGYERWRVTVDTRQYLITCNPTTKEITIVNTV